MTSFLGENIGGFEFWISNPHSYMWAMGGATASDLSAWARISVDWGYKAVVTAISPNQSYFAPNPAASPSPGPHSYAFLMISL